MYTFFSSKPNNCFISYFPIYPHSAAEAYQGKMLWASRQLYRIDRYHFTYCGFRHSIPELLTRRLLDYSLFQTLKIFLYNTPQLIHEKKFRPEFITLALSRIFPEKRKIPGGITIYGGSAWWSMTKECAEFVISSYAKNKVLRRFFKYTLIPDEMYFQTILMNSAFSTFLENNHYREIEFEGGDGTHPIVFRKEHLDRLKSSEAFFARKFDADVDPEILDMIDINLLKNK